MSRRATALLKTALAAVHCSGAGDLLAPYTRGAGVIFMLHQVDPTPPQAFEPNRLLHPEHAHELTALPRLSLNGDFQDLRYVKALLSGVPFALMNTLKRYTPARQLA